MSRKMKTRGCEVLAISSTGGHWVELLLLSAAFDGRDVIYASSNARDRAKVPGRRFEVLPDANARTPARAALCLWQVLRLVVRLRPAVIVSTGAAPGLFAVAVGRLFGATTIWVESLAGVTQLSLSGRLARRFARHFVVQWPELADGRSVQYHGNLL